MAKNRAVLGVEHIRDVVISASHTNVIQVNAPHRHDLMNESCVNNEVKAFNSKLRRKLEHFKNVQLIEVPSDRDLYTNHGQHLNWRGKETMAIKIALSTETVLRRKVTNGRKRTNLTTRDTQNVTWKKMK